MSPKFTPTSFMIFYVPVRPFRPASCSAKCRYLEYSELSEKDTISIQIFAKVVPPIPPIFNISLNLKLISGTPHASPILRHPRVSVRSKWLGRLAKVFQRHTDLRSLGPQNPEDFTGRGWAAGRFRSWPSHYFSLRYKWPERFGFSDWIGYITLLSPVFSWQSVRFCQIWCCCICLQQTFGRFWQLDGRSPR